MASIPVTYTYKTVGACAIRADVYSPPPAAASGATLVYLHGGALTYGSRQNIGAAQLGEYLQAGYTVVSIDYRLAPETKLPAIITDLQDAFRWVADSGPRLWGSDARHIAVVGHSAGGYMALMAGCCVLPRPRAIVSFYGYGDVIADWYGKPDPFYCQQPRVSEEESEINVAGPETAELYEGRGKGKLYLYCRQNGLWPLVVSGHDPASDTAFFTPYCPAKGATADYPPTLLLHGDRDTDVPYSQSVQMAQALAHLGVRHEVFTIAGGGHGFDRDLSDRVVRNAFDRVLAFLDAHLNDGPS